LNLGAHCAAAYGQLAAKQQQNGRACSTEDAMIAAIALTNKLVLVTRNTKDFDGITGLRVIDPWATLSV
jgi:toxin FitB